MLLIVHDDLILQFIYLLKLLILFVLPKVTHKEVEKKKVKKKKQEQRTASPAHSNQNSLIIFGFSKV